MEGVLSTTTGVLVAVASGAMIFFAAVFAPLVFTRLPAEVSGPFIRQVFPVYSAVLAGVTGVAALTAFAGGPGVAGVLAAVCVGFVYARQGLMPRINALRDRELAGDAASGPVFERLHRLSVALNFAQMVALFVLLVRVVG